MSLFLGGMLALVLCSVPVLAQADQTIAAEHYRRAMTQYKAGAYHTALTGFEHAYQADPAPALLYNIAQCHRHLNHRAKAIAYYRRYLQAAPNASDRAEVEDRIIKLKAERHKELAKVEPAADASQPQASPRDPAPANGTEANVKAPSTTAAKTPALGKAAHELSPAHVAAASITETEPQASPPWPSDDDSRESTAEALLTDPWLWASIGVVIVGTVAATLLVANGGGQPGSGRVCGEIGCVIATQARSY